MTLNEVRTFLRTSENYVLFRLPNEKMGRLIVSDHTDVSEAFPSSLEQLKNSFLMFPFSLGNHPILSISSKNLHFFELDDDSFRAPLKSEAQPSRPTPAYCEAFDKFVSAVRGGAFEKLVLSRTSSCLVPLQEPLSLFLRACAENSDAMVYLFHSSETGDWMGASPELLLTGDDAQLRTVALAGTMRNRDDAPVALSEWGDKERLEQSIVVDYIRGCISCFGTLKDEWGPYPVSAGHVSHLRTDFYFFMEQERRSDFITAIHPTPAVCGLPKESSLRFILDNEGYDREYYSGFMGWTDENGKMHLYVNIRCMKLVGSMAHFFAGGGILASSDLQSEWMETEEKMATMKRLLLD